VPVNHGSDDFELDAGNYVSGEGRPPTKAQGGGHSASSDTFLASTEEETTIPSTVSASDPSVRVSAHAYGYTIFDKLYLRNGTFFVVTRDVESMPARERILSKSEGVPGGMGVDATDQVCFNFAHSLVSFALADWLVDGCMRTGTPVYLAFGSERAPWRVCECREGCYCFRLRPMAIPSCE
jgi:hypothetical protein